MKSEKFLYPILPKGQPKKDQKSVPKIFDFWVPKIPKKIDFLVPVLSKKMPPEIDKKWFQKLLKNRSWKAMKKSKNH